MCVVSCVCVAYMRVQVGDHECTFDDCVMMRLWIATVPSKKLVLSSSLCTHTELVENVLNGI